MNKIISLIIIFLFLSCAEKQDNLEKVKSVKVDECGIPEMTLKSCIKPDYKKIATYPLGSKDNPVRVFMPEGQRAYLNSLKCVNGGLVKYKRLGSVGEGPYGFMLDLYEVKCELKSKGIEKEYSIYMDMYHKNYQENKVVDGFTF